LEHRINPNDAPPASLVRLPGIGLSGAQAIVTYRQQFRQQGRGDLAFRDCNDLRNIKGIGPAIVREMCEWLRFQ
jgi:DNA uptake protein ComE-like DNA-binding protein